MRGSIAFIVAAVMAWSGLAVAQDYPSKPIRLVVPFPPGGPVDAIARVVSQKMAGLLGQSVVIENRNGAGGVIGTQMAAKAEPDGYTIALTSAGALALSQGLHDKVPYDPLKDIRLLTQVANTPEVLALGRGIEARSLAELIALAKQRPGRLNFATAGKGSMSHLSLELFRQTAGIDITIVHYSGAGQAVNDLIGGHVDALFADIQVLLGSVQSGTLRALAIGGQRRAVPLPDLATTAELGLPRVVAFNWYGMVAQPGLSPPIAAKLTNTIIAAVRSDEVKARLAPQGVELVGNTPEEFSAFLRTEINRWGEVIRKAGIKAE